MQFSQLIIHLLDNTIIRHMMKTIDKAHSRHIAVYTGWQDSTLPIHHNIASSSFHIENTSAETQHDFINHRCSVLVVTPNVLCYHFWIDHKHNKNIGALNWGRRFTKFVWLQLPLRLKYRNSLRKHSFGSVVNIIIVCQHRDIYWLIMHLSQALYSWANVGGHR